MPGDNQCAPGSAPEACAGRPSRQPTAGAGRGQCARASAGGVHVRTGEASKGPAWPRDTVSRRSAGAAWSGGGGRPRCRLHAPCLPTVHASAPDRSWNWWHGSIAQPQSRAAALLSVVLGHMRLESTPHSPMPPPPLAPLLCPGSLQAQVAHWRDGGLLPAGKRVLLLVNAGLVYRHVWRSCPLPQHARL